MNKGIWITLSVTAILAALAFAVKKIIKE